MSKIPVILTFDKRIILAGAVAIQSLIDNAKPTTEYDIYVYLKQNMPFSLETLVLKLIWIVF